MTAYCAIRELGKRWDEHSQNLVHGKDWPDIVEQTKKTLREQNKTEARLSLSPGYYNQGHYITSY